MRDLQRFFRLVRLIVRDWHGVEFQYIRNSVIYAIAFPFIGLLVGAGFGDYPDVKRAIIDFALVVATILFFVVTWRRAKIGVEIGVLLKASEPDTKKGLARDVRAGIAAYLEFAAAILASEITIGGIVFWLPVHQNWIMGFYLIPVGVAAAAYSVWQGGGTWWRKIVLGVTVFSLVSSVAFVIRPRASQALLDTVVSNSNNDECLEAKIRGRVLPECGGRPIPSAGSSWRFELQPNQDLQTDVMVTEGMVLGFFASDPFYVLAGEPNGALRPYLMPPGRSGWRGGVPNGPLLLRGGPTQSVVQVIVERR